MLENDFWKLMAGELIGSGTYRDVYECRLDPTLVIKVEKSEGCFHNVREWDLWQTIEHAPKWRRWVAPCVRISPLGRYLLQKRTAPVTLRDMPAKVPAFFTDKKVGNWGRLDGKVVCHDYAIVIPDYSLRMVKGKWWEH